jgi:hypothetical protein
MSAAATEPLVRSKAECRADEIVAAFARCTNEAQVRETMRRAQRSIDALAALPDLIHWRRDASARGAAFQRHVNPPEPAPEGAAGEDTHA